MTSQGLLNVLSALIVTVTLSSIGMVVIHLNSAREVRELVIGPIASKQQSQESGPGFVPLFTVSIIPCYQVEVASTSESLLEKR